MGLFHFFTNSMATTSCNSSKPTCAVLWLTLTRLVDSQPVVRLTICIATWQDDSHLKSSWSDNSSTFSPPIHGVPEMITYPESGQRGPRSIHSTPQCLFVLLVSELPLAWFGVLRSQSFEVAQSLLNTDTENVETRTGEQRDPKSWRHHLSPKSSCTRKLGIPNLLISCISQYTLFFLCKPSCQTFTIARPNFMGPLISLGALVTVQF